jgi:penicillin-binding protein 1A
MLANVVDRGTAAPLRYKELGVVGPVAGKTGTTQFHSDGVFVGMSPKFLAGCWVGCFDRRVSFNTLRDGQGGKTALPIWGEFVKKLQQDPAYKPLFYGAWPEEYKWINDCPFTLDESQLVELDVEPGMPRDSTYTGPRKFHMKDDKRRGISKILQDIFGAKKQDGDNQQSQKQK